MPSMAHPHVSHRGGQQALTLSQIYCAPTEYAPSYETISTWIMAFYERQTDVTDSTRTGRRTSGMIRNRVPCGRPDERRPPSHLQTERTHAGHLSHHCIPHFQRAYCKKEGCSKMGLVKYRPCIECPSH